LECRTFMPKFPAMLNYSLRSPEASRCSLAGKYPQLTLNAWQLYLLMKVAYEMLGNCSGQVMG